LQPAARVYVPPGAERAELEAPEESLLLVMAFEPKQIAAAAPLAL